MHDRIKGLTTGKKAQFARSRSWTTGVPGFSLEECAREVASQLVTWIDRAKRECEYVRLSLSPTIGGRDGTQTYEITGRYDVTFDATQMIFKLCVCVRRTA